MNTETRDAVLRQIDRLSQYVLEDASLDLNVPTTYYSQRDNYRDPNRTCNSSSNAMYLDWLRRATGRGGLGGDDAFTRKVFDFGDTTVHENQTQALKWYGFNTKWNTDRDLPFVDLLLSAGFPVVVNILHRGSLAAPRGGHVILLAGLSRGRYFCQDPYGTLSSDYTNTHGRLARIAHTEFEARWQGGYRILA